MKEKIKLGYIGLGRRGSYVLRKCFAMMKDVEVTYICDLSNELLDKSAQDVFDNSGVTPKKTKDYHDIINDPEIDGVVVMTGWSGRP